MKNEFIITYFPEDVLNKRESLHWLVIKTNQSKKYVECVIASLQFALEDAWGQEVTMSNEHLVYLLNKYYPNLKASKHKSEKCVDFISRHDARESRCGMFYLTLKEKYLPNVGTFNEDVGNVNNILSFYNILGENDDSLIGMAFSYLDKLYDEKELPMNFQWSYLKAKEV